MLSPPARKPCLPLGWRRFVHLCLALLALCAITEPRVHAQISQNNWNGSVEVSTSTLTVREGERISYSVRLTHPPTEDADQNWWVMLQVDGARRGDGHYKGIGWTPSIGREFNGSNWDQWLDFTIEAKEDDDDTLDTTFTLTHEVWDHNSVCPVHGVGTVTVRVDGRQRVAAVDPAEVAEVDPAEAAVVDPAEVANRQRGFPAKLRRRELCLRWTFRISPMGMATPPIWCS